MRPGPGSSPRPVPRREVAQLAMEAASKVTRKALDSDSDRAILDDFLAEAGEKK